MIKGDVKEMQGLIDKHTLKFVSEPPKDARIITSKVVRTFKRDGVKSRLVLRDIAKSKPDGGELCATTPSMMTIRIATNDCGYLEKKSTNQYGVAWSNCGRRLTGLRACAD